MPCFDPLEGFRDPSGGISFARHKSTGLEMRLPCGRCIGCRLERSRQWAVRCMHEASLHEASCFVTLTYSDEFLPVNGSLSLEDPTKWLKRLRKRGRFRYFYCGEYGEEFLRPHYHALLFGRDFADRREVERTKSGQRQWVSEELSRTWPFGRATIGTVTFESAQYVASYCVKKLSGAAAEQSSRYERLDPETGEVVRVLPEFGNMSRRPGIGRGWIERYHEEVYPSDEVIARGRPGKPPRYYDAYLERVEPSVAETVRARRRRDRDRSEEDPERLHVRKVCTESRLKVSRRRELE